jgi:hypothetical protein
MSLTPQQQTSDPQQEDIPEDVYLKIKKKSCGRENILDNT